MTEPACDRLDPAASGRRVRLSISSSYAQAGRLAERCGTFCAGLPGGGGEPADALRLAVAEALNNIIRHAYRGVAGRPIDAEFRQTRVGCEVVLIDEGLPMPGGRPPEAASALDASDTQALSESGFGWLLIRAQTDAVVYRRQGGRNILRLAKRLGPPSA